MALTMISLSRDVVMAMMKERTTFSAEMGGRGGARRE
jgi:hypothetical protein